MRQDCPQKGLWQEAEPTGGSAGTESTAWAEPWLDTSWSGPVGNPHSSREGAASQGTESLTPPEPESSNWLSNPSHTAAQSLHFGSSFKRFRCRFQFPSESSRMNLFSFSSGGHAVPGSPDFPLLRSARRPPPTLKPCRDTRHTNCRMSEKETDCPGHWRRGWGGGSFCFSPGPFQSPTSRPGLPAAFRTILE